jgi:hypothetical protein
MRRKRKKEKNQDGNGTHGRRRRITVRKKRTTAQGVADPRRVGSRTERRRAVEENEGANPSTISAEQNWARPLRMSENQHEKWSSQIQNDKTKNETPSDFSTKIQHDSYTAEVTALPPSF